MYTRPTDDEIMKRVAHLVAVPREGIVNERKESKSIFDYPSDENWNSALVTINGNSQQDATEAEGGNK